MTELEKTVLATLAYYDVFDRPLTAWEVFRYAIKTELKTISFVAVLEVLTESKILREKISHFNGFYFLKERSALVGERIDRQKLADHKWKQARRFLKLLPAIPYIRMVAVSGSLALNNSKANSDIDLLIITKKGRIWTCRTLTTLAIHLLGKRRHHHLTKDRFCLNHYITDQSLQFTGKSLYNAQTYAHLVPVIGTGHLIYQFQKTNQWLLDYLFFYPFQTRGFIKNIKRSVFLNKARRYKEMILDTSVGDWLEKKLRKKQEQRIKKDPMTLKPGGRVVFNDNQLEFHPDSPEKGVLEKYNKKLEEIGLAALGHQKDSGLLAF